MDKEIILVIGKMCSGKDFYCQNVLSDYHQITTHDIVKDLIKCEVRSAMQDTKSLDMVIADELIATIKQTTAQKIVVSGIRQLSIMTSVFYYFKDVSIRLIETSRATRMERYYSNRQRSEDISFIKADKNEYELGIEDLIYGIRDRYEYTEVDGNARTVIVMMGSSGSGKGKVYKILKELKAEVGIDVVLTSIIDPIKEISFELFGENDPDPTQRTPEARAFLANLKDLVDEYGGKERATRHMIVDRIKRMQSGSMVVCDCREIKDAEYIKSQIDDCYIVFIDRADKESFKLRCENVDELELSAFADYILPNISNITDLKYEVQYFIDWIREN